MQDMGYLFIALGPLHPVLNPDAQYRGSLAKYGCVLRELGGEKSLVLLARDRGAFPSPLERPYRTWIFKENRVQ